MTIDRFVAPRVLLAHVACLCLFAAAAGCGDSTGRVSVTGSIKHPDGSIPKGLGTSYVGFVPESVHDPKARGGSGWIEAETGAFSIYTDKPGDGVLPGKYRVTLKIDTSYPPKENGASSVVPTEYLDPEKTPLVAEVSSSQRHFDFEVPKRQAKKAKK